MKKLYEVERITGRRNTEGKEEFLVHWKGYDSSDATWEPRENLSFCGDIVKKFVSKIIPIPGGVPCNISDFIQNKKKTIGVQLLLKKKGRMRKSRASLPADIKNKINERRKSKEVEKLIRDTLLHESKSMTPKKASLVMNGLFDFSKQDDTHQHGKVNGIISGVMENSRKRKFEEKSSLGQALKEERQFNTSLNGISVPGLQYWSVKNPLRDAGEGDYIICEKADKYMTIMLNNTAHHNVLTANMMETITNCLRNAEKDQTVHAILLKNNGDHFCSGIDYSELIDCKDDKTFKVKGNELCSSIRALTETLIDFSKPILTAANGACLEFGVALVALSDLSFTSSKTSFGLTFSKLDLTPVGCLTYLLPKMVGPTMANAMIYLGQSYRATAAYDRGLINDIYGVNSFDEDITKRIKKLAAGQIQVMQEAKRMLRSFDIDMLREACDAEIKAFSKCISSETCQQKLIQDWTSTINLYGAS